MLLNINLIQLLVLSNIILQAKSTTNHIANVVQEHEQDFENLTTTNLFEVHSEETGGLRGLSHMNQGCPIEGATCFDVKHDDRRRLSE